MIDDKMREKVSKSSERNRDHLQNYKQGPYKSPDPNCAAERNGPTHRKCHTQNRKCHTQNRKCLRAPEVPQGTGSTSGHRKCPRQRSKCLVTGNAPQALQLSPQGAANAVIISAGCYKYCNYLCKVPQAPPQAHSYQKYPPQGTALILQGVANPKKGVAVINWASLCKFWSSQLI